jgi:hypothetical protein
VALSATLSQVAGAAPDRATSEAVDLAASRARVGNLPTTARQAGRGFGGRGGAQGDIPLTQQFDTNGDGRLDAQERRAARTHAESTGLNRGRGGRRGGFPADVAAGRRVTPSDVEAHRGAPLFDPTTVRTLFLDFENDDWEGELMAFKPTDVEVPARLTVDGRAYPDVGVQFRGNSSFSQVPAGLKHSLSINVDWQHGSQDTR